MLKTQLVLRITLRYLLAIILFIVISPNDVFPSAQLIQANRVFSNRDYKSALSLYQDALANLKQQESFAPANTFLVETIKNKMTSIINAFSKPSNTPTPISKTFASNSSSIPTPVPTYTTPQGGNDRTYAYICLNMGECYLQQKDLSSAISIFGEGADKGGNSTIGLKCRFKEGLYKMNLHDYQGAYDSLNKYLKQNVNLDKSKYDRQNLSSAIYMTGICAWKLYRDDPKFKNNLVDALALKNQVLKIIPDVDNKLYFKH